MAGAIRTVRRTGGSGSVTPYSRSRDASSNSSSSQQQYNTTSQDRIGSETDGMLKNKLGSVMAGLIRAAVNTYATIFGPEDSFPTPPRPSAATVSNMAAKVRKLTPQRSMTSRMEEGRVAGDVQEDRKEVLPADQYRPLEAYPKEVAAGYYKSLPNRQTTPSTKSGAKRKYKTVDERPVAVPQEMLANGSQSQTKEVIGNSADNVNSEKNIETDQGSLISLSNGDIDVSLSDPRLQLDPYEFPRNTTAGILAAWREVCKRKQQIQRESKLASFSNRNSNALTFPRAASSLDNARQRYWEPVMDYVEPMRSPRPEPAQPKSPTHQHYALQRHRSIPSMLNGTNPYERPSNSLSRKQSRGNLSVASSRGQRRNKEHKHVDSKDVRKRKRAESTTKLEQTSARSRSESPMKEPPPVPAPVSPVKALVPSAPTTQIVPSPFSRHHRSRPSTPNALLPISITPERRRRAGFFSARDEDLDSIPEPTNSYYEEGLEQVVKRARGPNGSALTPIKRSQSYSAFKTRVAPLTESPAVLALRAQREVERMAAIKNQSERQERVKEITESNAKTFASSMSKSDIIDPAEAQTAKASMEPVPAFGGFKFPTDKIEDNNVETFDIPIAAQPSSDASRFDLQKPILAQNNTNEPPRAAPTFSFPTAPKLASTGISEKSSTPFAFGARPQNGEPKNDENKGSSFSKPLESVKPAVPTFGGFNAAPAIAQPNGLPDSEKPKFNEAFNIFESKPSMGPSAASKTETTPKFTFGGPSVSNDSLPSLVPSSEKKEFSFTAPTSSTNAFAKPVGDAALTSLTFGPKDAITSTSATFGPNTLNDSKKATPSFSFEKPAEQSSAPSNPSVFAPSFGVGKQEGLTTGTQLFGQSDTKTTPFSFGSNVATPALSPSPASPVPSFSFNNTSNTASFVGFGGSKSEGNPFGTTAALAQTDFKFGSNAQTQSTGEQPKFTFGAPAQPSPFTSTASATAPSASPAPFQFGAPTPSAASPAPFQFGSAGPASPSAAASFNFTAASPTPMDPSVSNPFATGAATSQASPTVAGRKLAVPRSRKPMSRR